MSLERNRRILIIDDNEAIHHDFRKILCPRTELSGLIAAEAAIFGDQPAADVPAVESFEIDSAYQGQDGLRMVSQTEVAAKPYALAFVDVRMPPGWDGVETVARIWAQYPDLQVVICTAYSDHTWSDMVARLGQREGLVVLKKPFDPIEVQQLACALTAKWDLARQARMKLQDLETLVSERTAQIEQASRQLREINDALLEAKEAAEASSIAKTRFLANVSHEIRTPLTAILGYADFLLEPDQTPDQRTECVQIIRRNGDNLLQIVNDILDLSKIEAGRLTIDKMPFSPLQVAQDVVSLLVVRANEKKLSLQIEGDGVVPAAVMSDPARLRQILINLVGNAIKFTEHGGIRIVIGAAKGSSSSESMLRFDVIDTGIGISPELATRLFQPFAQADDTATRRRGGTGLGLSISRRLAEALGGSLTLESEPGKGSRFRATIACETIPADASPRPQANEIHSPNAATPLRPARFDMPCRILLAEDTPDIQRLVAAMLRKAGADVQVIGDGRSAVETALGGDFDVVLMDMQLPEMDGQTATRALRAAKYDRPVIALTAHSMSAERDTCLQAGCNDFVTKPVRRDELVAAITAQMRKQPAHSLATAT